MIDFKILVGLGLFCSFRCVCIVAFKKFTSLESVDNKICLPQDRIFTVSVPSYADNLGLTVCVTHCITNGVCKSIFYNSVDSTCTACNGVYDVTSALDDSTGSKYYASNTKLYQENCIYPDDYCMEPNQECFTDTCICSPGYSYNPSNKTCVDSDTCSSYGTTFQLYQGCRINGSNVRAFSNISVMECTDACVSDALCASVDYRTTPFLKCHIQYVNIKTAESRFVVDSEYELHVRDCA